MKKLSREEMKNVMGGRPPKDPSGCAVLYGGCVIDDQHPPIFGNCCAGLECAPIPQYPYDRACRAII